MPKISTNAGSLSLVAGLVLFAAGALLALAFPDHGFFLVLRWSGLLLLAFAGVRGRSLTYWIFIAMLVGFELGIDRPEFAVRLRVLGDIFLRLIKVIVAPLNSGDAGYGNRGPRQPEKSGENRAEEPGLFQGDRHDCGLFLRFWGVNMGRTGEGVHLPAPATDQERLHRPRR